MSENRRGFIGKMLAGSGALAIGAMTACDRLAKGDKLAQGIGTAQAAENVPSLVKVTGPDPYKNTIKALDMLGGMERFVKKGQRVAVLPNIGWARTMEEGANTHPEVVRAVIEMCEALDVKSITLFCNPCADIRVTLEKSGIGGVVERTSARFEAINKNGWRDRKAVKGCTHMKDAQIYRLVEDSDVLLNVPVAKHHGSAQLTMCCKNLMGLVKDRGYMHQSLHESIADLTMMVPHALCVLDASRILLRNGPSGGNVDDVERKDTVIAGINPVNVDAIGTTLFGKKPSDIKHLKILSDRGIGQIDPSKLSMETAKA